MQRQYSIKLYTIYKNQFPKMTFIQHDTEDNKITFELFDDIDVPMSGIVEATATVKREDNKTFTYGMDCFEIVDNLVTFILPPSSVYVAGKYTASVSLYDNNLGRLTTQTFSYEVTEELISDTPVDETNEYPVLTKLINDINTATEGFKASGLTGVDAEVVLARKGEATLRDKMDKVDNSLDEKVNYKNNIKPIIPICTFLCDDGTTTDWTLLKPLFDSKNIPCSIAVISNYIDTTGYLTSSQLQTLYSAGWEILSHTVSHQDLPTLNDTDLDYELKHSQDVFNNLGFNCKSIVYPRGVYDGRVINNTKKYYRSGIATEYGINYSPIDTFAIKRVVLGHNPNFTGCDNVTWYKSQVDFAYNNNLWLIWQLHSADLSDSKVLDDLTQVIDYIKSKNMQIMNVDNALNTFENFINEQNGTTKFIVGANGNQNNAMINIDNIKVDQNTPLYMFPKGMSVKHIYYSDGANFSGYTAGKLTTDNVSTNENLCTQEFIPMVLNTTNFNLKLKREWDASNKVWGTWKANNFVPACRVFSSVNQSIVSGTPTALSFNSERFDTDNMHDNTTNPSRLTCNTSGIYLINATLVFDINGTGLRKAEIKINGTATNICQDAEYLPQATRYHYLNPSGVYKLNAGDYVEVIATQTSGANLNVLVTQNDSFEFSMARIG